MRWHSPVKTGVVALALLAIAFLPVVAREQAIPAYNPDNLIRLHILANSDDAADQVLKQKVRDEIVRAVGPDFTGVSDVVAARNVAASDLEYIREVAVGKVRAEGKDYPVSVDLGRYPFPTKSYGNFILPAGEYEAVKVVIGRGGGANWWCVLFPPLCFVDLSREAGPAAPAPGSSIVITGNNKGGEADPPALSVAGNNPGGTGKGAGDMPVGLADPGGAPATGPPEFTFRFKIVDILQNFFKKSGYGQDRQV